MIVHLVTDANAYAMTDFLEVWCRGLRRRVRLVFYDDVVYLPVPRRGTYIFSNLVQMPPAHLELACEIARQLSDAGARVLNQPSRVLRRYDLLRSLYEKGMNRFAAYRLADGRMPGRFPVFLRHEKEHGGSLTPLLHTRHELERATEEVLRAGEDPEDLLLVEYCDTSDRYGVFRKYSAFLIGDRFIPCHVFFSSDWITKFPGFTDDDRAREELEYLEQSPHPHEQRLREVFQLARIDYGRVDYGLLDGNVQVWEINTNPTIIRPLADVAPQRLAGQARVAGRLCSALRSLDDDGSPDEWLRIRIDHDLRRRLGVREIDRWAHPLKRVVRRIGTRRAVRPITRRLTALLQSRR